jgi:hypothetical protein
MTQDVQLNWLARYLPIARQLAQLDGPVLEVGSGAVGLGLLWDKRFIGCDRVFEQRPVSSMSAVIGSAERLAFGDREFGTVVASDVLEHLPAHHRPDMVYEIIRVSRRWIIIGAPCGPAAEQADRRLEHWFTRRGRPIPGWLTEHQMFGLPGPQDVDHLLEEHGRVTWSVLPNENIWLHLCFMVFDTTRVGQKLNSRVWQWQPSLLTWAAGMAQWGPCYRHIYVIERTDD